MKAVNFFSRFTFICNIAFLLFVFLRWLELRKHAAAVSDKLITVPYVENTIIVLGVSAIVINLIMNIFYFIFLVRGKINQLTLWIVLVNFIFLILQVAYFFL